jgi:hypothetical protein
MRGARVLAALIVMGGVALGPGSAAATNAATNAVTKEAPDGSVSKVGRPPRAEPVGDTSYPLGPSGPAFQEPVVSGSITNGSPANAVDHPYIVGIRSIFWEDNGNGGLDGWQSTCTGTILSATKILTAGHCTVDLPLGTTYVIAGRNDLDNTGGGFVAAVASTWVHQSYGTSNNAPRNDVAVLTLRQALPSAYTPIPMVAQGNTAGEVNGTSAQILGYGITASGQADSGILRTATTPIRSDSTCSTGLGVGFDAATMLCAGNPGSGIDTCGGDSGGPIVATLGGVKTQVGVTSWGPVQCGDSYGAYAQLSSFNSLITADLTRPDPNNLDWTGDGHSDLIARTPGGQLLLYYGTGLVSPPSMPAFGGLVTSIGTGWGSFAKLFRVRNWNGDGTESIFAMRGDGGLVQYRSDGEGNFTTGQAELIGSGWTAFRDIMVTTNWTGNGRPNLLGRTAGGDLYLYTSNGSGGWMNSGIGIKIGNGWNMFDTVLTPGTWLGDGLQALIGRTPAGQLRLYQSNGAGGWVNGVGVPIGSGWNVFTKFMSPGDLNGDNQVDMIGVNSAGGLYLYPSDGHGNWLNSGIGIMIGSGWNTLNAIF